LALISAMHEYDPDVDHGHKELCDAQSLFMAALQKAQS